MKTKRLFGGGIGSDSLGELGRALRVERALLEDVHFKYERCGMTREAIADWVEREYESKLPQKVRESDADYKKRVITEITNGAHHEASQKVAG